MRAEASLVAAVLAAALVAPIGPVQLSYVYSDSMEPAMETNDGFVLVPAGTIQEGDVITYQSTEQDALVTHRVVERTPEGFVTQGDANPSTDQAAGAPPVERSQVVGEALSVGGQPITIPGVGVLASLIDTYSRVAAGGVLALLGWALFGGHDRRTRETNREDPSTSGEIVTTVAVAAAVVVLVLPVAGAASQSVTYEAVDGPAEGAQTISTSEEVVRTETFTLEGSTQEVAIQASGMTIQEEVRDGNELTLTMAIPPAEQAGEVSKTVRVYTYPALTPAAPFAPLETIHPLLAIWAAIGAVFVPLTLLGLLGIDRHRRLRFRDTRLQELVT